MSAPETKVINMSWTLTNEAELMDKLGGLSKKGWHLVGYKRPNYLKLWQPFGFLFEKREPEERVYRADFRRGSKADIEEYISLCEEAGWKNLYAKQGFFIFYTPADQAAHADFFTDTGSKIAKVKRQRLHVLILGAVFTPVLFYIMSFMQGMFSTEANLYPAMFTAYVLYMIYVVIRLSLNIRHLQGSSLETHQGKAIKTGARRLIAELNAITALTLVLMPISAHFLLSDWHWSWEWHIIQSFGLLVMYLVFRIFIALRIKSQRLP